MIKLIGILIIIIGFLLKLDTIAVVLTSGVITGIVGGLGFGEILETLGQAFITNRYMTIFFVTLPIIGLLEKYGLKERAASLISDLKAATTGKILSFYMVLRTIAAALSLRIGGHVEFIRPLIYPMAEGAAKNKYGELSEEETEDIKGLSASVENKIGYWIVLVIISYYFYIRRTYTCKTCRNYSTYNGDIDSNRTGKGGKL